MIRKIFVFAVLFFSLFLPLDTKEKSKQSSLLESEGQEDFSSDESETIQSVDSPADVHENIKSKFLVEMPEDFFDFWRFCKELNEEDPLGLE